MNKRHKVWIGAGVAVVIVVAVALQILSRPPESSNVAPPAIGDDEIAATLAALKPPKRARPVVAMIGINDATEVTDYVMPAGILLRADVADVLMVATGPGPVKLYRALLRSRELLAQSRHATASASFRIRSVVIGRRKMSSTHSGIGRRLRLWTKSWPASRLVTVRARATSSPCSWSIHG